MKRAAVLSISGGLDSTCLLMTLLAKDYEVKAYSFKYGQKHVIELEKVQKNIKFLQDKGFPINHQVIDLTSAFNESASSLSSFSGVEIPEGSYMEEKMKSTVVENRNVIFASILYGKALAWANREERDVEIFLGIHAGDHAIYPDCTPESREACEHAFKVSNWNSEKVSYQAPFVNIDKAGVLKEGVKAMESLGFKEEEVMFILSNTHTCYNPSSDGFSCGKCGSCNERVLAFYENGLIDPVPYQEPWEVVLRRAKAE